MAAAWPETKVNGDFIQSPTIWRRRDAKVRGNEITVNNIRSVRVKKREGERERNRREKGEKHAANARMGLVISLETGESSWPSIRSEAIFALLRFVVSLASPFGPRSLLLLLLSFPTILPLLTRAKPRPFSVFLPPFQNEPDCRCLVPCCADLYLSVSLSPSHFARFAVRPLLFRVVSEARATEHKGIEKDRTIR